MCVVSMVYDHFSEKWDKQLKNLETVIFPLDSTPVVPLPVVSPAEIEEFKKLLERAREYDKKHNEPDCELQEKKDTLLKLAKQLRIDISFIDKN